jgi:hypothetical protein
MDSRLSSREKKKKERKLELILDARFKPLNDYLLDVHFRCCRESATLSAVMSVVVVDAIVCSRVAYDGYAFAAEVGEVAPLSRSNTGKQRVEGRWWPPSISPNIRLNNIKPIHSIYSIYSSVKLRIATGTLLPCQVYIRRGSQHCLFSIL